MNLINLVKVYAINSLGINKIFNKGDQPKTLKSVLITVAMVIGGLFILNASFGYSILISSAVNDKSLILGIMTTASALIVFFTVIYIVKGVIVGFADYEMLMALPIDTKIIIISRLLILYFYSLILTIFILVPANIIYCIKVGPAFEFYILTSIVCSLFVSVMGIVVNLLFPKLNWKTETIVVKQSMSTLMAILFGQIPVLICGLLIILINGYSSYFIISIATIIVA
ncbi:MAG: hypothetical protein ACRC68_15915, partial [Clostridium sp.]